MGRKFHVYDAVALTVSRYHPKLVPVENGENDAGKGSEKEPSPINPYPE